LTEHESCVIPSMAVGELLTDDAAESLNLVLVSGGDGLQNIINQPRIQMPGLALAGFLEYIRSGSVQVLGKSEIDFLNEKPSPERSRIVSQLCRQDGSCFILTSDLLPPAELVEETERHRVPLLKTNLQSSIAVDKLTIYLEDRLAPTMVIHGVLLDIYAMGVLLLGDSGVGKSESALDLVVRGHRLVSDDVVELKRRGEAIIGTGPELTRFHMELRGLGIINVKDLFGVASVREKMSIEYVIQLDTWKADKRYDRLGIEDNSYELLGVNLPFVEMPVGPGRNLSVLIEVAARNHLLKLKGYHPARELARRLGQRLQIGSQDEIADYQDYPHDLSAEDGEPDE
jgi:HPr kinase/phosphorylase